MKIQVLLSSKDKSKKLKCRLLQFLFGALRVKIYFHIEYSSIQMKCQGGNKYGLSITVKFDQSTRRFGRISCARLFKFTKHIALLFYLFFFVTIFTVVYERFKKYQNEYAYY